MNLPEIPHDRQVWNGAIADYWFDEGILISRSKPQKRTVALIRENAELVKTISGGKAVPLLIYLCDSPVPDKETRRFSAEMVPQIYTAMAMVTKPGLAQLVMKMVFALKKPTIPIKSFSDTDAAKDWLKRLVC